MDGHWLLRNIIILLFDALKRPFGFSAIPQTFPDDGGGEAAGFDDSASATRSSHRLISTDVFPDAQCLNDPVCSMETPPLGVTAAPQNTVGGVFSG